MQQIDVQFMLRKCVADSSGSSLAHGVMRTESHVSWKCFRVLRTSLDVVFENFFSADVNGQVVVDHGLCCSILVVVHCA